MQNSKLNRDVCVQSTNSTAVKPHSVCTGSGQVAKIVMRMCTFRNTCKSGPSKSYKQENRVSITCLLAESVCTTPRSPVPDGLLQQRTRLWNGINNTVIESCELRHDVKKLVSIVQRTRRLPVTTTVFNASMLQLNNRESLKTVPQLEH